MPGPPCKAQRKGSSVPASCPLSCARTCCATVLLILQNRYAHISKLAVCQPLNAPNAPNPPNPQNVKTRPQGPIHRFFRAVPSAVCQDFAANRRPKACFQRRQKRPQGQIHRFFWAVQRAVRQAFAANRRPKATSMASYGLPSLPFASP